nr:cyclophilin-like fold protein [Rhodoferax sp.]
MKWLTFWRASAVRRGARAWLSAVALSVCALAVISAAPVYAQEPSMKIRLHVNGEIAVATLHDNATARDFLALLPLSLTLKDFAKVERIGDLPRKLVVKDPQSGMDPAVGDLAYYAPWNNFVVFAGANKFDRGLVPLGKVESGLAALQRPGPLKVRIERLKD